MGLFDFWIKKRKEDISENKEKEYTLLDLAKSGCEDKEENLRRIYEEYN